MPTPEPNPTAPARVPHGLNETDAGARTFTSPVPGTAGGAPARVGRFEVRRLLGEGAFARVYLALDPDLNREVALKVPKTEALTPEFCDSFIRENRLAAIIHHANVCPVYEVGSHEGVPYIVMRVVPETLAGLVQRLRAPMPAKNAVAVTRKLALGLVAAHAQNVIHRDLKPANVLYDDANREVLIADFGLARFADQATVASNGVPKGTPAYMAPEQARGRAHEVGPHSDVYSLGVILYELLVGRVPFGGSIWEVMRDHCETAPVPPSAARAGLDPRLDALCLKALAKDPKDRYRSAKDFAHALAEYLRAGAAPVTAPEPAWASVVLVEEPPKAESVKPAAPVLPRSKSLPPPLPRPVAPPAPQPVPRATPVREPERGTARRAGPFWYVLAALLLVGTVAGVIVSRRDRSTPPESPRSALDTAAADELARDWADYKSAAYSTSSAKFVAERAPTRWTEWQRAAEGGDPRAMTMYARCLNLGTGATKNPTAAFEWYKKAAERGEPVAMNGVGYCYSQGEGTVADTKEALVWFQKAAELGEPYAISNIANFYERGEGVSPDPQRAFEGYRKAADRGASIAMRHLGRCYENGTGTRPDPVLAREWYQKAADSGEPDGMCHLGRCWEYEIGGPRDYAKAREWYAKADAEGSAAGTYNLAGLYAFARGVDKDLPRAHDLYLKAATQGYAHAQYQVGYNFANSSGTKEDFVKARDWYEKAAGNGNSGAMNNLGVLYAKGQGVAKSWPKAIEWYEKSAAAGDVYAMTNLAGVYYNGHHVPEDEPKAKEWYEKAANKEHAPAQFQLGTMHERGIKFTNGLSGAPDYHKALMWYRRAAKNGHADADKAIERVTELQKKEAKK